MEDPRLALERVRTERAVLMTLAVGGLFYMPSLFFLWYMFREYIAWVVFS